MEAHHCLQFHFQVIQSLFLASLVTWHLSGAHIHTLAKHLIHIKVNNFLKEIISRVRKENHINLVIYITMWEVSFGENIIETIKKSPSTISHWLIHWKASQIDRTSHIYETLIIYNTRRDEFSNAISNIAKVKHTLVMLCQYFLNLMFTTKFLYLYSLLSCCGAGDKVCLSRGDRMRKRF